MDLDGAAAIITGGASGIGEASARALARLGARCLLIDLNEERGRAVASEIGGLHVKADVADEEQVQAAVDAASELGPVRALLNAAGIGNANRTVDRNGVPFPLDAFEFVVRVNLIGTFNCIRLAAAAMAKTEPVNADGARGAIVNTRVGRRVRRPDRPGRVLRVEGRRRRASRCRSRVTSRRSACG